MTLLLILVNSLSNPHCSSRHVPRGSPSRGGARRPFTEGGALSFELRMFPGGHFFNRAVEDASTEAERQRYITIPPSSPCWCAFLKLSLLLTA